MTKKIFFELKSLEQYVLILKCLNELIMKEDLILEAGFLDFELLQVAKIVIGSYLYEMKRREKMRKVVGLIFLVLYFFVLLLGIVFL